MHLRVKPDPRSGERFPQIAPARFAERRAEIIKPCRRVPSLFFAEALPLRISKYYSAIDGENGQPLLHRSQQIFIKPLQQTHLGLQLPNHTHLPLQVPTLASNL